MTSPVHIRPQDEAHKRRRWLGAIVSTALVLGACGGRESIGTFCEGDWDAATVASEGAPDVGCGPAQCSVIGAWQNFGLLASPPPACDEGAIRFDSSGALSRLTRNGWVNACSYSTCGERVLGSQLSTVIATDPRGGTRANCGPSYEVSIRPDFSPDAAPFPCVIHADAPCSPAPTSINVFYYPCTP